MIRFAAALSVAGLVLATTTSARADDEAEARREKTSEKSYARWEKRPLAFVGVMGLGTPVGLGGVMLEYAPAPELVLAAGAGLSQSPQWAVMPRLRLVVHPAVAFSLGGGVSGGGYTARDPIPCFGCDKS